MQHIIIASMAFITFVIFIVLDFRQRLKENYEEEKTLFLVALMSFAFSIAILVSLIS